MGESNEPLPETSGDTRQCITELERKIQEHREKQQVLMRAFDESMNNMIVLQNEMSQLQKGSEYAPAPRVLAPIGKITPSVDNSGFGSTPRPHEIIRLQRLQRQLMEIEEAELIPRELLYMGDFSDKGECMNEPIGRNIIAFRQSICSKVIPSSSIEAIEIISQLPGKRDTWHSSWKWVGEEKEGLKRLHALSAFAQREIKETIGVESLPTQERIATDIRWLIRRDRPEVLANDREAFAQSDLYDVWEEEDYDRALRQRNCIGMVAEHKHEIVGHIVYELHKHCLHLLRFVVRGDVRNRSIAESMIMKLYGKITPMKRKHIQMDLPSSDIETMEFLSACGLHTLREFQRPVDRDQESTARMILTKKEILVPKAASKKEWLQIADAFLTQVA